MVMIFVSLVNGLYCLVYFIYIYLFIVWSKISFYGFIFLVSVRSGGKIVKVWVL